MMHKLLLLRPDDQAGSLVSMLQQRAALMGMQAECLVHSMVNICGYDDPNHSLRNILSQTWHGGLMVSVNAANYFAQQAQAWAPECKMPVARWFAVGPTSAKAIAQVVQRPVTCPWRKHNSDALLQLPELQDVAHQQWLLVRGRGGRELAADTLRARGAHVTYLEVYQRVPNKVSAATIEQWQEQVHGIVVSSAEQLGYFLAALPQHALHWLAQCYWVLASERLAQLIPVAMRQRVVIADSATPFALADAWQTLIKKEDL
ncbi:uroporphyrinogen-III synthase [Pseudidiomarina woesei]|uniref:Uroporphyrinogen-III synthase n=1 Tax=Pseudidiomarina woesei TaxID=1381080 RepID=A0A0K6H641_9GAMM|nr:uroporphyrinogen-III synthase [Pseudidiomarina woesei]CUA86303.1 Uroporphyrinogen-III synthase [Pseudidiomarina woesei]